MNKGDQRNIYFLIALLFHISHKLYNSQAIQQYSL